MLAPPFPPYALPLSRNTVLNQALFSLSYFCQCLGHTQVKGWFQGDA